MGILTTYIINTWGHFFFQTLNFLFFFSYWPRADEQYCDFRWTVTHTHVSILPQTPLPSRLPHDTGQRSLSCPAGPCWFSMLNTAVCPCPSQTPWLSLPPFFALGTIRLLQSIEQSSLCWTAGPCWFSMVNTAVCPWTSHGNELSQHWI